MNKRNLFILFCFLTMQIFSESVDTKKICDITIGSEIDSVGFSQRLIGSGESFAPTSLFLFEDEIYIVDPLNNKVVVFSLDGNFIKSIMIDSNFIYLNSPSFKVFKNYLAFFDPYYGFAAFDMNGRFLFNVSKRELSSSTLVRSDYYMFDDYFIFYSKGKWLAYDLTGELLSNSDMNDLFIDASDYESIIDSNFKKYLIENIALVVDGLVYSGSFKFFSNFSQEEILKKLDIPAAYTLGADSHLNHYWQSGSANRSYIIVTNNSGSYIDSIETTENDCLYEIFTVSLDGDIYSLRVNEMSLSLWKTERNW